MSTAPNDNSSLSPLKRALLALKDMRARLDEVERAAAEPIAIIGVGCRFPGGANDPESYWKLLRDGVDAVCEVPASRWDAAEYYDPDPDTPGKMNTRWGGFLRDGVDGFDARFFGITPREAVSMDPQQRLLLEVAWEALEHAGQSPAILNGSATGVFAGICTNDYSRLFDGPARIDSYMSTGNAFSVAAGRLSYILGLQGPSLAVDTACSSSLVAVHLAVQSLRSRECRMALAAGVNLILSPISSLALSHLRMMAPDGRCKTFDAAADGFVRGEGCGVVVLKRLRDAVADGDHILALIRGTAVNQDGRSGGLTAPNGPAQEAVIRRALANAGVAPADVDYVEAHGTGTALGDPIECKALGAVFGEGRDPSRQLLLASVKTNIGHLEAAAGIAGVIKVALALSHGEIPPHLHLKSLSSHISFGNLSVAIPPAVTAWPSHQGTRIAGLSSFGFSGTNAHAVFEGAPDIAATPSTEAAHLLCLSARSGEALQQSVQRFREHLAAHPEQPFADICATANSGRAHFEHRLAIIAATTAECQEALASGQWIAGQVAEGVSPKIGFVFTDAPSLSAQEWIRWGVMPGAVLGHGAGEYAAGMAAGIFAAEDSIPRAPQLPYLSSRCGGRVKTPDLVDAGYWQSNAPAGERLREGVEALRQEGCELFLHFGPRPAGASGQWFPGETVLETLARCYTAGVPVDWAAFYAGSGRRKVPLPTYPFERRRYWLDVAETPQPPASEWLYDLEWHPRTDSSSSLNGPVTVARQVEPQVAGLASRFGLDVYGRFLPETDALAVAYCAQALRDLGCELPRDLGGEPEVLAARIGISPKHRRLFGRIVEIVESAAIPAPSDLEERYGSLLARYPACEGELALFAGCGRKLGGVLRGEIDPLHILFPAGSVAAVERLYQESPFFQAMNTLVGEAFTAALPASSAQTRTRILEVGAGTGGATAYVLPRLTGHNVEYAFTDVSPLFTAHAARKFNAYPFVRYGLLDIERDTSPQGYAEGSFDIVLAANVLHATADLRQTLRHVRRLLAPGGMLVLLEGTRPQQWADLVFGLTEGWWRFSDTDLRPVHPLLPKARWLDVLRECGFTEPVAVPSDESVEGRASKQVLILARTAADESVASTGSCALVPDHTGVADAFAAATSCVRLAADAREIPQASHILHFAAMDAPAASDLSPATLDGAVLATCTSALHLAQSLAGRAQPPRLWLITRGAQRVRADDREISPAQAPLWGLGRVIGLEHPEIWGGLIDLDPVPSARESAAILKIIRGGGDEDQFALRAGVAYVPRLTPSRDAVARSSKPLFHGGASYLVTGGLGALGLRIARWMVERGARHLTLAGLTGVAGDDLRAEAIRDLERLGATVEVVQVDVADAGAITPVVRRLLDAARPLRGIIHAAGVSVPQPIRGIDAGTLQAVLRPKVAGSWILHQATKDRALDFFVCFSSAAAIWGTVGGGHYAAANHFLDALTHHRRALGLPALTLNWARWEGEGMASSSDEVGRFFDQIGLGAMPSTRALDLMGCLMQAGAVQKTVAAVDWSIFKPVYEARRRRPLLDRIQVTAAACTEAHADNAGLLRDLEAAAEGDRWNLLLTRMQQEVASVLGFGAGEQPALDEGFFKLGMDSLTSVELKTRLEAALGRTLPPTLAFEYSTIESLARHLYSELFGATPAENAGLVELEQLSEEDAHAELLAELASLKRELQ